MFEPSCIYIYLYRKKNHVFGDKNVPQKCSCQYNLFSFKNIIRKNISKLTYVNGIQLRVVQDRGLLSLKVW